MFIFTNLLIAIEKYKLKYNNYPKKLLLDPDYYAIIKRDINNVTLPKSKLTDNDKQLIYNIPFVIKDNLKENYKLI